MIAIEKKDDYFSTLRSGKRIAKKIYRETIVARVSDIFMQ